MPLSYKSVSGTSKEYSLTMFCFHPKDLKKLFFDLNIPLVKPVLKPAKPFPSLTLPLVTPAAAPKPEQKNNN